MKTMVLGEGRLQFAGGILGFKAIIEKSPGEEIYVYSGLNYIEFREQF